MEASKRKGHVDFVLRWSPVGVFAALVLAILSMWFAPFSVIYAGTAAVTGLALTIFTVISWKAEPNELRDTLVNLAAILIVTLVEMWVERWVFPDSHFGDLWLAIQYYCIVFGMGFAVLSVFKAPIKHSCSAILTHLCRLHQ